IHRARRKVKEKVLRRLRCVVILPWREIVKVMGGVVMKMTTKIAIVGIGVTLATGGGVWVGYHLVRSSTSNVQGRIEMKEETVQTETKLTAPHRIQGGKPTSDELTFEEFNRWLDEALDEMEKEIESEAVPKSEPIKTTLPHRQAMTSKAQSDKPWESDPEYQRLDREFKEKRRRLIVVSSRADEIGRRLDQLPREGPASDPRMQERLSLEEEFNSLNWERFFLQTELIELWKAKEAIKKSYKERVR
ncbi:hypothetical protein J7M22_07215, partial [Candidatus Poribacteria bacterium]|nr:hypothetical protein [Candidatus Poribacteria bacterium]